MVINRYNFFLIGKNFFRHDTIVMNRLLFFIFSMFILSGVAQIERVKLDTTLVKEIKEESLLFLLYLNDYSLEDAVARLKLIINEKGFYQYKDSTLVNAAVKINLHKFLKADKNNIPDCGTLPIQNGYLQGNIVSGKKEGKWLKKIKTPKYPHYVTVKILHYKNGVLDGKYQTYNTDGKALYPSEPHPLFPDEYKDYQMFKNGTGRYYDYYYEIGVLKIDGFYKNNKKHNEWIYYDKKGNEIHKE